MQIVCGTAGAGQTTAAVIRVGDLASNNIDTTIANATTTFDSGAVTNAFSGGTAIAIRVNLASVGGTPPANCNVTAQYRMQ